MKHFVRLLLWARTSLLRLDLFEETPELYLRETLEIEAVGRVEAWTLPMVERGLWKPALSNDW